MNVAMDPWARLRAATPARIGLGRSGCAQPLQAQLAFQLAHARARDAVHAAVDWDAVAETLPGASVRVRSQAEGRADYLKRPDLGRRLAEGAALDVGNPPDVVLVIADGLSAAAVAASGAAVARAVMGALPELSFGPVVLAEQSRVAIGDEIGHRLGARLVVLLVGERPGLTVADSLGAYVTYAPRVGRRDSERNCVSNIHGQGGLSAEAAARTIAWLVRAALDRGLTGTGLKDASLARGAEAGQLEP
ncbi:ethanolamine ammonia-lyase subunit EutC [Sagittula sp. M10.9X]|uniref:Ethanolamine ammonia-lyase small subunit n=2 Tax=Sagittula salina TaxID=2820268 RepID=A0A940S297_9RHOB|nr:ethanolamine ammonia-lyase subunit EutC [Sagittula salina]